MTLVNSWANCSEWSYLEAEWLHSIPQFLHDDQHLKKFDHLTQIVSDECKRQKNQFWILVSEYIRITYFSDSSLNCVVIIILWNPQGEETIIMLSEGNYHNVVRTRLTIAMKRDEDVDQSKKMTRQLLFETSSTAHQYNDLRRNFTELMKWQLHENK